MITSFGEDKAGLDVNALRAFVCLHFLSVSLSLGAIDWHRLVVVALHGLFHFFIKSKDFFIAYITNDVLT